MAIQLENGYTKLANELIEAFSQICLSGREWQILWVIIRKTYGFNKKKDNISLTQFKEMTGIETCHVAKVLKKLEEKEIIKIDRNQYLNRYCLNKQCLNRYCPNGMKLLPKQAVKLLPKQAVTKETKKNKRNTVAKATPSIKLGKETYSMEELTYEPLDAPTKSKNPYGRKVMAVLVRKFAECAEVELSETFDASPWSKPLGAIYRNFGKDAKKTLAFIERATEYFKEKELSFTPHTLHKDLPLIEKWIKKENKVNPDLYD